MQIVQAGEVEIKDSGALRQHLSIAELDQPIQLKVFKTAEDAAAKKSSQVEVKVGMWPNELDNNFAAGAKRTKAGEAERKIEDIELKLGDFPNKAWAWCPEPSSKPDDAVKEEFGLLILLPEPGDVDRNKMREVWLPLLREGWCVAVVQAANKSRWSSEEIELVERVRDTVAEKREIDAGRTVVVVKVSAADWLWSLPAWPKARSMECSRSERRWRMPSCSAREFAERLDAFHVGRCA